MSLCSGQTRATSAISLMPTLINDLQPTSTRTLVLTQTHARVLIGTCRTELALRKSTIAEETSVCTSTENAKRRPSSAACQSAQPPISTEGGAAV